MMGIIAAFTSCTNDDITISKAINIKVNPSTVIAPFDFEWETGDLETFNTAYNLRIQLLIYNEDGILAAKETVYGTNYATIANTNLFLPNGEYTAIAITDVVKYDKDEDKTTFSYWDLKDEAKLTSAKIEDTGYFSSERGILGLAKQKIKVTEGQNQSFTINVEPAGGLFLMTLFNPFYYSDVNRLGILVNKNASHYGFDSNGNFNVSQETSGSDYDWWMFYLNLEDYNKESEYIYGYYFIPAMNNYRMKFVARTDDNEYNLSSPLTMNIEKGVEYLLLLNTYDEEEGGAYMGCTPINSEVERANPYSTTDKLLQKIGADEFTKGAINDGIYLKDVK